jgi:hypothetical protein
MLDSHSIARARGIERNANHDMSGTAPTVCFVFNKPDIRGARRTQLVCKLLRCGMRSIPENQPRLKKKWSDRSRDITCAYNEDLIAGIWVQ